MDPGSTKEEREEVSEMGRTWRVIAGAGCIITIAVATVDRVEAAPTAGITAEIGSMFTEQKKVKEAEPKRILPDRKNADQRMMAKMATAEAEGESVEGKALVIRVILNRVENESFPETVGEVIYQQGQWESITDGRYSEAEPSEECWKAMEMVLNGWDNSEGATYFNRSDTKGWHNKALCFLFTCEHHSFFREA